jgi:hypothetical protein
MAQFVILVVCVGIFYACNDNTGINSQVPSRVKMVMRSQDTASVELGIDAVPESDGIQVQWQKLYHPSLRYYHLWRKGEYDLTFTRIKVIDPERSSQGGDTTYIDMDINFDPPTYYFYFVAAANKEGNEGTPSDTVKYMLLDKAILISPDQGVIDSNFIFKWEFNTEHHPEPQEYILRIEEAFTKKMIYSHVFWNENLLPGVFTLNLSDKEPDFAIPEGNYRWRIDCIGEDAESSGSESEWLHFMIE